MGEIRYLDKRICFLVNRAAYILLALLCAGCSTEKPAEIAAAQSRIPDQVSFSLDVRPILSDRCYACHGPDVEGRVTEFHFDTEEGLRTRLKESRRSRAVKGGSLGGSELFHRITSDDPEYRMPPPESNLSLTTAEKAILVRWIEQGAEFESHWAYTPPVSQPLPTVSKTDWPRDALDSFILDRLEREGLSPSEELSREAWLRRVSFDLIGLPPTILELDAFLVDDSPDAYEAAVDRLLDSDQYGERMAVEWLDLARYADSHGYQDDGWRNMWPWRDWVIRSFNDNVPYDKFVSDQLAGDLYENPTRDEILATGFNRNHLQSQEGGIVLEEFRVDYVADRTDTFGKAFLGISTGCAKCHDHRYDPVSQAEYYELFAFFNSVNEIGNIPYSGEASPTVILTSEEDDAQLKEIRQAMARLEPMIDPANSIYDVEFAEWMTTHNSAVTPRGMTAHYPIEEFVEKDDLLTLEDRVQPDSAAYFWGDKDNLPKIVDGVEGKAMTLVGDGWLDAGNKRHHFDRTDPFSLSLWFKIEDPDSFGPLMAKTSGLFDGNRGYHVFLNPDHTFSSSLVHVGPANQLSIKTKDVVTNSEWHHVVMAYDGSSRAAGLKLFLDGVQMNSEIEIDNLKQSTTVTIDPFTGDSTNWAGDGDLRLGFSENNQPMLDGVTVDELKVFNRKLTLPEIEVLAGLDSSQTDLRDYYLSTESEGYRDSFDQIKKLRERENFILTHAHEVMVMDDLAEQRETRVLYRGQYDQPLQSVTHGTPDAILPFPEDLPKNRLGLTQWLFDEEHPLTARVAVNRLWQQVFGKGIVESADNFGSQGTVPTHPRLLDYLAIEYRNAGWDTKAMLKRLVLSATYRQRSVAPAATIEIDPNNLLLARGPSRRLTAEMMRDNALASSGLLVPVIGGMPVKPYQPAGLWKEQATRNGTEYVQDQGDDLYRRSLYTIWKRTTPPPAMMNFDTSERNLCTIKRQSTSTPLQALVLMNDPQFVEAARILAERMISEGGLLDRSKIEYGFRLLTSRSPTPDELETLSVLLDEQRLSFQQTPRAALDLLSTGEFERNHDLVASEVAAFTTLASTIMNFDATTYLR